MTIASMLLCVHTSIVGDFPGELPVMSYCEVGIGVNTITLYVITLYVIELPLLISVMASVMIFN